MAGFVTCPSCQLKHSARPDGICPRCKSPVSPGIPPAGTTDDGVWTGPPPTLPDSPSPGPRPSIAAVRTGRTADAEPDGPNLGIRAAGVYFALNGLVTAMTVVRNSTGAGRSDVGFTVAGLSLALGIGILSGAEKAVTVAKVLSAIGFAALLVGSFVLDSGALAAFTVVMAVALFSLLIGNPGRLRIGLSAALLGASLLFGMFLSAGNEWATATTMRAIGQIVGDPVASIEGDKFEYTIPLPKKGQWFVAGPLMLKAIGESADRAVFSPRHQALVAVLVMKLPGSGATVGRIADAVEAELAKNASIEKISRDELVGKVPGIVLRNRVVQGGTKAEMVQALVLRGRVFYTVQMTVPSENFEGANRDFKKIIAEFEPRNPTDFAQPVYDTSPTPGPPSVFGNRSAPRRPTPSRY